MRKVMAASLALLLACACAGAPPAPPSTGAVDGGPPDAAASAPEKTELLDADSPRRTKEGTSFLAPAGWRLTVRGAETLLDPPEPNSHIALIDVRAKDADAAVAAAWKIYEPAMEWPVEAATDVPDRDGWTKQRRYAYRTAPNAKRDVTVAARFNGDAWTVIIYDMDHSVGEGRMSAIAVIASKMLPRGYVRETFAGKHARPLDAARLAQLTTFTEHARTQLGITGVALGIVQDGKVVFADGFGARELGKPEKPDADTLFMIGSTTKALTTLMLAKLVDEKKLTWTTPVTSVLRSFALGDAETTQQVQIKHLICACTGMPRQDLEWLFEFKNLTPARALETLATMQPTSRFGETFQYSNPLAAAGGFVGGHVAYPNRELGAAYDEAMRTRVFEPIGMKATTFDFEKAQAQNHAAPSGPDLQDTPSKIDMGMNYALRPLRPAGAAWSNLRDLLTYVSLELAEGKLPSGKSYIDPKVLLERRVPQVAIGPDETYGMGLMVNTKYGVPIVHHGGDVFGFHGDMMWLPENNVGLVILTNDELGTVLRTQIRRKLLEVLFNGKPEADLEIASAAKAFKDNLISQRKELTIPADPGQTTKLARRYRNEALGDLTVISTPDSTIFDFGEWKSSVASRVNPDQTVSFVTIAPGIIGLDFVVGPPDTRTLTIRDAQHEYVFTEQ